MCVCDLEIVSQRLLLQQPCLYSSSICTSLLPPHTFSFLVPKRCPKAVLNVSRLRKSTKYNASGPMTETHGPSPKPHMSISASISLIPNLNNVSGVECKKEGHTLHKAQAREAVIYFSQSLRLLLKPRQGYPALHVWLDNGLR